MAILSTVWSITPLHSLLEALRFTLICAAGLTLVAGALSLGPVERESCYRWSLRGMIAGLVLLAMIAIAHRSLSGALAGTGIDLWLERLTRFDRGATTIALLLWPAMGGLWVRRRTISSAGLVALDLVITLGLSSLSAILSLVIGVGLFLFAEWAPRAAAATIGLVIITAVCLLPSLTPDMATIAQIHGTVPWLKGSAIHRLVIWRFVGDKIAERPLLGWGLDSARAVPGGGDLIMDPRLPELAEADGRYLPLHPHNAALQLRLELGIPGGVLGLSGLLWLLNRACAQGADKSIAIALIGGGLVIALLSYGFWQAWWQSTLWLIAALFIVISPNAGASDRPDLERYAP